jgi:hypothetical protein
MTVRMWLKMGQYPNLATRNLVWQPTSAAGTAFAMETSTNLTTWITLFTVTNKCNVTTYFVNNPASHNRFYRLVPQ